MRRRYYEVRGLAWIHWQGSGQTKVLYVSIRLRSVRQYSPSVACSLITQQMKDMKVNKTMQNTTSLLTEWCGQQFREWQASFICILVFWSVLQIIDHGKESFLWETPNPARNGFKSRVCLLQQDGGKRSIYLALWLILQCFYVCRSTSIWPLCAA